jgi:hypothetical protein
MVLLQCFRDRGGSYCSLYYLVNFVFGYVKGKANCGSLFRCR